MSKALLIIALALFVSGCSLYRSSDRDYFDSNGRTGAPAASAAAQEFDARADVPNGDLSLRARIDYPQK